MREQSSLHTFPFPLVESLESQIQEHRKEVLGPGRWADVVWEKNQLGRKGERWASYRVGDSSPPWTRW